jgi:hypothetical protein
LTAIDKNLSIDLGADYLVRALRNRRARPPFALRMGSRRHGKRKCDQRDGECCCPAAKTVDHEFLH